MERYIEKSGSWLPLGKLEVLVPWTHIPSSFPREDLLAGYTYPTACAVWVLHSRWLQALGLEA